jgi:hypothetical protein
VLHPLAVEGSPMIYEAVEEQFKVGDWVVILNYGKLIHDSLKNENPYAQKGKCCKIKKLEKGIMYFEDGMRMNWSNTNKAKHYEFGNSHTYLRHATPAEIEAAQPKPERKALCVTEDGVSLYDRDIAYMVYKTGFNTGGRADKVYKFSMSNSFIWYDALCYFSSKEKAQAYLDAIHNPKPVKSLKFANGLPENERKLWLSQWQDKDYHSLIEIMRYAADMDDTKRGILEDAARAIFKGEFEVEQK